MDRRTEEDGGDVSLLCPHVTENEELSQAAALIFATSKLYVQLPSFPLTDTGTGRES